MKMVMAGRILNQLIILYLLIVKKKMGVNYTFSISVFEIEFQSGCEDPFAKLPSPDHFSKTSFIK